MLLSVCIITRNNARLFKAINSVRLVADEILVFYTEEEKPAILQNEYNIKYYRVDWKGNYQVLRNLALQKASGRWVFFMKPTEELSSHYKLREILKKTDNTGFYLPLIELKERGIKAPHLSLRLFRNIKGYYYKGELYESIMSSITESSKECSFKVLQLPLITGNYFKINLIEFDRMPLYYPDVNRTLEGILYFWQAYFSFISADYHKTLHYLKYILSEKQDEPEIKGNAYFLMGLAYQELNDYYLSERLLLKAIKLIGPGKLLMRGIKNIYMKKGKTLSELVSVLEDRGISALYNLMKLYYYERNYVKALEVLSYIPAEQQEKYYFWKGKVKFQLGDYEEAFRLLKGISPAFIKYTEVMEILWLLNLKRNPRKESKSIINQIKLLGDPLAWNIVNIFNKIYFHGEEVHLKFSNMITMFRFYQKLLHYLDLMVEFNIEKQMGDTSLSENQEIEIILEIIENTKIKRAAGDIALIYYRHRKWGKAYSFMKKDLEYGKALPELLIMAEICFRLKKEKEGREYRNLASRLDETYEKLFFRNKK